MLKCEIKVHKSWSNRFLDDISTNNPGTEKNGKN